MAKPELGTKRTDPDTGKKFYDLGRDPIVSPYTGKSYPLSHFESEEQVRPAASSRSSGRSRAAAPKPERETETVEAETSEDTVSLDEVADEEEDAASSETSGSPDVDDNEDDALESDDNTYLNEDDDENDDVSEIIGGSKDGDED